MCALLEWKKENQQDSTEAAQMLRTDHPQITPISNDQLGFDFVFTSA